jgi:hypothetical protein
MFGSQHARHVLVDWERTTRVVMARIRSAHARLPRDAELHDLLRRLCEVSARARRLWQQDTTVMDWPGTLTIRAPGHTDPQQVDDRRRHVAVNTLFLHLPREGDERLLAIFQLPPGLEQLGAIPAGDCVACERARGQGTA